MRWIKKIIITTFFLIGVFATVIIGLFIFMESRCVAELSKSYQPFDSQKWKETVFDGAVSQTRILMIDDLLDHQNFKGWQKSQIIELLGRPTEDKLDRIDYYLGPQRSCFGMDSETLVLILKDERVERYYIYVD